MAGACASGMRSGSRPKCRIASRSERRPVVGAIEQRRIERAGQRAAAEKRHAEAHAFLVGESDDLDGKWKPLLAEQLDERDGQDDAEHAVEGAGIRHRVEMRADVEARRSGDRRRRQSRRIDAAKIPDGVDAHRHADARHPGGQRRVHVAHRLGEKRARGGVAIFRQLRQLPAPADDLARPARSTS